MPAEWEPHEATWIAWPHNRSDWPGKFEPILWVYAEIVRHLARVEQVNILVNDEAAEAKARQILVRSDVLPEKASRRARRPATSSFCAVPTNRVWTRDYGPIFVRRESRKKDPAGHRRDGLAIQRLGQVQRLEARRAGRSRDREAAARSGVAARTQELAARCTASCWKAAASTSTAAAR